MYVVRLLLVVWCIAGVFAARKELSEDELAQKCATCRKIISEFKKKIKRSAMDNLTLFKEGVQGVCGAYPVGSKEWTFCNKIGGLPESTEGDILTVKRGLSYTSEMEKCKELYESFSELCVDKVKLVIDWTNMNVKKQSIKYLRKILREYEVSTDGIVEKSELVDLVDEIRNNELKKVKSDEL